MKLFVHKNDAQMSGFAVVNKVPYQRKKNFFEKKFLPGYL